ncbi:MAG TPA: hypothetical protein VFE24_14705, partial [Pirellulales bacterium]|nr:hypothetical protein [Pirellulales bacterium]
FLSIYDDHFQTSTDGVTWKPQAAAKFTAADGIGSGYLRRWAASKDTVVFAGDYALGDKPRIGWIGSSQNGATPLRVETEPADVRGLAFGHGEFVACTKDGVLLRSNDGQKFEHVVTLDDQFDDGCLRFYRERFYVRGRHGMQVSIDGLKWEPLAKSLRIPRAVAPDGVAVDCGWGGLDYAADGEHYQKAKVPIDPTGICDVLYVVPRDQATATTKK